MEHEARIGVLQKGLPEVLEYLERAFSICRDLPLFPTRGDLEFVLELHPTLIPKNLEEAEVVGEIVSEILYTSAFAKIYRPGLDSTNKIGKGLWFSTRLDFERRYGQSFHDWVYRELVDLLASDEEPKTPVEETIKVLANPVVFYGSGPMWGELTSFYHAPFVVDGEEWPTLEHFYQARKFESSELQFQVRSAPTPEDARELGKKLGPLRAGWEDLRFAVLKRGMTQKFTASEQCRAALLATGERELLFNDPNDSLWGCEVDDSGRRVHGQNQYGEILMQVRDQVKALESQRKRDLCAERRLQQRQQQDPAGESRLERPHLGWGAPSIEGLRGTCMSKIDIVTWYLISAVMRLVFPVDELHCDLRTDRSMNELSVTTLVKYLHHKATYKSGWIRGGFFLLYFTLMLVTVLLPFRVLHHYYVNSRLVASFVEADINDAATRSFMDVETVSDVYTWLRKVWVAEIWGGKRVGDEQYLAGGFNLLVNTPLLFQFRVPAVGESRAPLSGAGTAVEAAPFGPNLTWRSTCLEWLDAGAPVYPVFFQFASVMYNEAMGNVTGSVYNATSLSEAREVIDRLESGRWIDKYTAYVAAYVVVYNTVLDILSSLRLVIVQTDSGVLVPRATVYDELGNSHGGSVIQSRKLHPHDDSSALVFLEVLLLLITLCYTYSEYLQLRQAKREMGSYMAYLNIWNVVDTVTLSLMYVKFVLWAVSTESLGIPDGAVLLDNTLNPSVWPVHGAAVTVNCCLMMCFTARVFKHFRFGFNFALFTATFSRVRRDLAYFLFLLFVMLAGYSVAVHYYLGRTSGDFSEFTSSIIAVVAYFVGESGWQYFSDPPSDVTSGVLPMVMYWGFTIVVLYIMTNMFLALVLGAFESCKTEANAHRHSMKKEGHFLVRSFWAVLGIDYAAVLNELMCKGVHSQQQDSYTPLVEMIRADHPLSWKSRMRVTRGSIEINIGQKHRGRGLWREEPGDAAPPAAPYLFIEIPGGGHTQAVEDDDAPETPAIIHPSVVNKVIANELPYDSLAVLRIPHDGSGNLVGVPFVVQLRNGSSCSVTLVAEDRLEWDNGWVWSRGVPGRDIDGSWWDRNGLRMVIDRATHTVDVDQPDGNPEVGHLFPAKWSDFDEVRCRWDFVSHGGFLRIHVAAVCPRCRQNAEDGMPCPSNSWVTHRARVVKMRKGRVQWPSFSSLEIRHKAFSPKMSLAVYEVYLGPFRLYPTVAHNLVVSLPSTLRVLPFVVRETSVSYHDVKARLIEVHEERHAFAHDTLLHHLLREIKQTAGAPERPAQSEASAVTEALFMHSKVKATAASMPIPRSCGSRYLELLAST